MALTARAGQKWRKWVPKHPKEILVAETDDEIHFSIAHPKTLPWFANPVAEPGQHNGRGGHGHEHHQHAPAEQTNSSHGSASGSLAEKHNTRIEAHKLRAAEGEPELKLAHEATVIQLFYDLFFVANLTTFTGVHEINDADSLKSYIGFFSILWFTWLQVSLYDIRFGVDSVWERFCKALQFGIMTGFAVVGPAYQVGWGLDETKATQAAQAFKALSLILMASRIILLVQYAVVGYWLRHHRRTWAPIFIHCLTLLCTSMIFLGLSFSFGPDSGDNSLIAWYIVIGLEALVILLTSGKFNFLSFRKTVIVERLGLLTLIILGEGVIGLCLSIQKVGSDQAFSPDVIGMIICGVIIIYAQWMLYFDQTETERVGTIRQLIWTVLHFPYHVSILLLVEGVSQISVWRKLIDQWDYLNNVIANIPNPADEEGIGETVSQVNETMNQFFETFEEGLGRTKYQTPDQTEHYQNLTWIYQSWFENDMNPNATYTNGTNTTIGDAIDDVWSDIFFDGASFAAANYGVEPPESLSEEASKSSQLLELLVNDTFTTIFVYFFICAGLSLILTSALFFFGKRNKVRGDFLNIFFRTLVGLGLTLLVIMNSLTSDAGVNNYDVFAFGPWMLPTVTIALAVVVVVDNLLINYVRKLVTGRGTYRPANDV